MAEKPSTTSFAQVAGISIGYASDILTNKRPMPRPLAIMTYRKLGWKHASIARLTERQIKVLETVEPWVAPKERTAA